ncbi:hypothetical protein K488DRAFT_67076 [Vararia minispora EC-137]|uniref:Uncharacterized protein n=1 Tax=Vararia minispora EC-137 TaxID=1314806 RepID=A0ACB8QZM0_9AGAM|nr:hypothetical protein K488DRAFT_67076 [Vararia minispora EC-137]
MLTRLLSTARLAIVAAARPVARADSGTSVALGGRTYVNKGIVAFGRILLRRNRVYSPSETRSMGRSQAPLLFTLIGASIGFILTPYSGSGALSFDDASSTPWLTYRNTLLYIGRDNAAMIRVHALGVRPARAGFSPTHQATADLPIPVASSTNNRFALDLEGLMLNGDGTCAALPDEAVRRFSRWRAFLPPNDHGKSDFTFDDYPATSRADNQGLERAISVRMECLILRLATPSLWSILWDSDGPSLS